MSEQQDQPKPQVVRCLWCRRPLKDPTQAYCSKECERNDNDEGSRFSYRRPSINARRNVRDL